uniref:Putative a-kinase anchor protein 1 n=1 Tax=Corethrella appendiculata TaxID=1370023 RepID=U5EQ12_9DIPT
MAPSRPLLYLSLPSLAIIIGLVWYRRKRSIHCDTGGGNKRNSSSFKKDVTENCNGVYTSQENLKHSDSLPITSSPISSTKNHNKDKKLHSPNNNNNNNNSASSSSSSTSSSFSGKSAPINIVSNTRSPPMKFTEQQFDTELLKLKIQESDTKVLQSIEEQDDCCSISPIDLPGTVKRRDKFQAFNKSIEPVVEPVVVKASMTAKISPPNSFASEIRKTDDTNSMKETETNTAEIKLESNIKSNRNPPVSSPPLSECSSMHSGDSGKGSSPPHSVGAPHSVNAPLISYDFIIPSYLIGKLLGKKVSFAKHIKAKSGANILIKSNFTKKSKICSIEGTQVEIDAAIAIIRKRLPIKRYPEVTLERVCVEQNKNIVPLPVIDTSCLNLNLIEGINNDVVISAIINGGHIFVQQPLHPSFPSLNILQNCMNLSYSNIETPVLPDIVLDSVCTAPIQNNWYRVQIISSDNDTKTCLVKYLDFGGYTNVSSKDLRQIRTDFMSIPFQSTECILSNVKPLNDSTWSAEAADILHNLTSGLILQAQVAGYSVDGIPEIYLYATVAKDNVIFINQELVARGLAEWVEDSQ